MASSPPPEVQAVAQTRWHLATRVGVEGKALGIQACTSHTRILSFPARPSISSWEDANNPSTGDAGVGPAHRLLLTAAQRHAGTESVHALGTTVV